MVLCAMEGVEAVTKGSLKHWTLSLNNFHHLDASPLLCYWDQCLEISGLASSVAALYCGSRTKAPQWKPCTFEQGFPLFQLQAPVLTTDFMVICITIYFSSVELLVNFRFNSNFDILLQEPDFCSPTFFLCTCVMMLGCKISTDLS